MASRGPSLAGRVAALRREANAVILSHNYQLPAIQDVADFVGDSLELSIKAVETDAKTIAFCGVDFMAEQAAILNPGKTVLHPDPGAQCPMAKMLTRETIAEYRRRYPSAPLVLYVNTLANEKAEADYVVTSSSAVKLVEQLDADAVLFGPDANLAEFVAEKAGKEVIPVPPTGFCPLHVTITALDIEEQRASHPDALVIAHPECTADVRALASFVGSTSQMVRAAKELPASEVIVATEVGLLHRLRKESPGKVFVPACREGICINMKKITLAKLYRSLREGVHPVNVPERVAGKVRAALQRSFDVLGIEVPWGRR